MGIERVFLRQMGEIPAALSIKEPEELPIEYLTALFDGLETYAQGYAALAITQLPDTLLQTFAIDLVSDTLPPAFYAEGWLYLNGTTTDYMGRGFPALGMCGSVAGGEAAYVIPMYDTADVTYYKWRPGVESPIFQRKTVNPMDNKSPHEITHLGGETEADTHKALLNPFTPSTLSLLRRLYRENLDPFLATTPFIWWDQEQQTMVNGMFSDYQNID